MKPRNAVKTLALSRCYPRVSPLINTGLVLAMALLMVGVAAPLMSLSKLFIFNSQVTLLSAVGQLWQEGHWMLFVIVGLFSIVMPTIKIVVLTAVWNRPFSARGKLHRMLHWIALYGKWSMLDVFVVAVLLVSVKLGALASVQVHYGLYAFSGSVLISMAASMWIIHVARLEESA